MTRGITMDMHIVDNRFEGQVATDLERLHSELRHYRQQSEKLQKINMLYQRMAGILDLPSMIEAFSIWLMETVSHELVGYHNPGWRRTHMFCSYHGPKRRLAIQQAQSVLEEQPDPSGDPALLATEDFTVHKWELNTLNCKGVLVILSQGKPLADHELQFIDETLAIISDPLKRALEYEAIFTQARHDSLTGLPNRFVFDERIGYIVEQAKRYGHPLTLAALDLDHFKAVNDTMGHLKGDQVLKQVAEAMSNEVRTTDLLVRMGGDEFLLVLPDTDITAANILAERLCEVVRQLEVVTSSGPLAISIGLAAWSSELSIAQWVERADDTLYQAKSNGRAQVVISEPAEHFWPTLDLQEASI